MSNISQTPTEQALAALVGLSFNNPLYFTKGVTFNVFDKIAIINSSRCPTDLLSGLLAVVLADQQPKMIQGPPLWSTFPIKGTVDRDGVLNLDPPFYGSFSQNVPWWQMPDGTLIPVYCIAQCFTHGFSAANALISVHQEISYDMQATADAQNK